MRKNEATNGDIISFVCEFDIIDIKRISELSNYSKGIYTHK